MSRYAALESRRPVTPAEGISQFCPNCLVITQTIGDQRAELSYKGKLAVVDMGRGFDSKEYIRKQRRKGLRGKDKHVGIPLVGRRMPVCGCDLRISTDDTFVLGRAMYTANVLIPHAKLVFLCEKVMDRLTRLSK